VPLDPAGVAAGIARVAQDRDAYATAAGSAASRLGTTDFTDRLLGP
jgi:hypothetical protein